MNKWVRRLLEIVVFFLLWLIIGFIDAMLNHKHKLSSLDTPLPFIILMFVISYYVCYSS